MAGESIRDDREGERMWSRRTIGCGVVGVVLYGLLALPALAGFQVVALGSGGGLSGDNLPAYLIRHERDTRYLGLDAGSTLPGIAKALAQGAFPEASAERAAPWTPQGYVLRELIAAYFISHAHLDHVAGLLLAAPEDSRKPIYTLASSAETLRNHYFNWKSWPNFSDAGQGPRLGTYRIHSVRPAQRFTLGNSGMSAQVYPLSHGGVTSAMILLERSGEYFAYFGDTGADSVEQSSHLDRIWRRLGPLLASGALQGMIIETSFSDAVPQTHLFGHLTPHLLNQELTNLARYSGGAAALAGFPVVIAHIKPSLQAGETAAQTIMAQLAAGNSNGVVFRHLQQGEHALFSGRE
ncbi:3',5'-cyclic-nucleotide phosphodiesterase [Edwardsiella tarda]|nr:3',5'-cyclic-nucleotide phosphodiesterase [Edwardsiella tarda]WKS81993.1 3',5'-cyclic-nucleotide phosphodiesterase [Edwardsiella tarda]